jgi:hypothetical protein
MATASSTPKNSSSYSTMRRVTDVEVARHEPSFSDTVNRLVLRVACTESHEDVSPVKRRAPAAPAGGGPLTPQELSDLSLLCTYSNDIRSKGDQQNPYGFATVEGDQLLGLLDLLDRHISAAVGVDFIQEAVDLLKAESPSKASASLDEVCEDCDVFCGEYSALKPYNDAHFLWILVHSPTCVTPSCSGFDQEEPVALICLQWDWKQLLSSSS